MQNKALINDDILFLINPSSGNKKIESIVESLQSLTPPIKYIINVEKKDLKKSFRKNLAQYKVFVVVGGDGTVNKAIKHLHKHPDKVFGVLPAGSGNGFANEMGFQKSVASLLEDIKRGETIQVDILSVNKKPCINAAGIGFDSYVAHQFQNSKGRGLRNYVLITLKSIFSYKPFYASLNFGQDKIEGLFHTITLANTRQFGNNAIIAPMAKPNDEKIELVLIKPFPLYLYPAFVARLFLGTLKNSKYVQYISTNENIEIESEFNIYHVDGEPKSFQKRLHIKLKKEKVSLVKTKANPLKS